MVILTYSTWEALVYCDNNSTGEALVYGDLNLRYWGGISFTVILTHTTWKALVYGAILSM